VYEKNRFYYYNIIWVGTYICTRNVIRSKRTQFRFFFLSYHNDDRFKSQFSATHRCKFSTITLYRYYLSIHCEYGGEFTTITGKLKWHLSTRTTLLSVFHKVVFLFIFFIVYFPNLDGMLKKHQAILYFFKSYCLFWLSRGRL